MPEEIEVNLDSPYRVLCVTKRTRGDKGGTRPIRWHERIQGTAIVSMQQATGDGASDCDKRVVTFDNWSGDFLYTRPGLSGTAVVIAFKVVGQNYDVMELYTSTPIDGFTEKEVQIVAGATQERFERAWRK